jgi:hypothetical protein
MNPYVSQPRSDAETGSWGSPVLHLRARAVDFPKMEQSCAVARRGSQPKGSIYQTVERLVLTLQTRNEISGVCSGIDGSLV